MTYRAMSKEHTHEKKPADEIAGYGLHQSGVLLKAESQQSYCDENPNKLFTPSEGSSLGCEGKDMISKKHLFQRGISLLAALCCFGALTPVHKVCKVSSMV